MSERPLPAEGGVPPVLQQEDGGPGEATAGQEYQWPGRS